jgi:hypothetical protein
MARVAAVGLGPPLVALQRARFGRLGQMRLGTDRAQLLDHEPPARRGLQRDLELLTGKPRQEPPDTDTIGRHHTRARHLASLSVQPLRGDLRTVLIQTHHDRHDSLLEHATRPTRARPWPTPRTGRHPAHAIFAREAGAISKAPPLSVLRASQRCRRQRCDARGQPADKAC